MDLLWISGFDLVNFLITVITLFSCLQSTQTTRIVCPTTRTTDLMLRQSWRFPTARYEKKTKSVTPDSSKNTDGSGALTKGGRKKCKKTVPLQGSVKYISAETVQGIWEQQWALGRSSLRGCSHFPSDSSPAGASVSELSQFTAGRMEQRERWHVSFSLCQHTPPVRSELPRLPFLSPKTAASEVRNRWLHFWEV